MSVKTYSRSRDGDKQLSANFRVKEFASKCGADTVYICPKLIDALQYIRDALGKPVRINSGYRTPEHNKKVGGAANSQHMYGRAADIAVTGVDTVTVCKAAENALRAVNVPGAIIRYHTKNNFVHIDTRAARLRQENDGSKAYHVAGWSSAATSTGAIRPQLELGARGDDVAVLQRRLKELGNASLEVDGKFGSKTEFAVRAFQTLRGLTVDGIVGAKTWAALGV